MTQSETVFAFEPPPIVSLPIADRADRVPIRRVFCIGRNYAAHAREMGHDPDREPPFFFTKPADALVPGGGAIDFPTATSDLHHEVELVVVIGRGGRDISAEDALSHVFGYAVGIDLTRRDLQADAKAKGRPWDMAKGFDQSAPIGLIHTVEQVGHRAAGAIALSVNGKIRQSGDLADQIWPVPDSIAFLSGLIDLAPGDLIFTGTPDGVGPIEAGDVLHASIDRLGELILTVG